MNPLSDCDVWQHLSAHKRRRLTAALASSEQTWVKFTIPGTVTNEQIAAFARRNLLRGFFECNSRIITGVCARRIAGGIELRIGFSAHLPGISLPCWGCSFRRALELVFGHVESRGPVDPTEEAHR